MAWTREIPTKPGFYWYSDVSHTETIVELITEGGPTMRIRFLGWGEVVPAKEFGGQFWDVPISFPPLV